MNRYYSNYNKKNGKINKSYAKSSKFDTNQY